MKLLDLYKSILDAAGLRTDSEGYVSTAYIPGSDMSEPVTINGKRLVLPTREQLTAPDTGSTMIFHPLSENILGGESEVITKLRRCFTTRLNYNTFAIASRLLEICATVEEHKKLSPDQSEMLTAIGDADAKTLENFIKIVTKSFNDSDDKSFISLYLKRGGIKEGRKYSRLGVVSFPFYEKLLEEPDTILGVKLRVKDKSAFRNLMEYIFPSLEKEGFYNRGSDSDVAPYLDGLMQTTGALASRLNDVLALFEGLFEEEEFLTVNSDWVQPFEDLAAFKPEIRMIPMQAGNDGRAPVTAAQPVEPAQAPVQQAPTIQYATPQPQVQPTMQQPMMQQPMQPMQQQQPVQQGPVITERGLDIRSIGPNFQSQQVPMGMMPQGMQMQAPQQNIMNTLPRWAMPQTPVPNMYGYNPQMPMQQPMYPQMGVMGGYNVPVR